MNSTDPSAHQAPPRIAPGHYSAANRQPLGESPEEREPILTAVGAIDAILRSRGG